MAGSHREKTIGGKIIRVSPVFYDALHSLADTYNVSMYRLTEILGYNLKNSPLILLPPPQNTNKRKKQLVELPPPFFL